MLIVVSVEMVVLVRFYQAARLTMIRHKSFVMNKQGRSSGRGSDRERDSVGRFQSLSS